MWTSSVLLWCFLSFSTAVYNERERAYGENSSDESCAHCATITRLAEWAKMNQLGSEYIKEQVMRMCSTSKHSYACLEQCQQLVPFISDAVDGDLANEGEICQTVTGGRCSAAAMKTTAGVFECSICHLFSKYLAEKVQATAGGDLKQLLQRVCQSKVLSENGRKTCTLLFDEHFDEMFAIILKLLLSDKACKVSRMCIAAPITEEQIMRDLENSQTLKNVTCSVCKTFIGLVEKLFKKTEFEGVMLKTMKTVCSLMPTKKLQQQCAQFVDDEVASRLDCIIETLTPDVFCPLIGFCDSTVEN